MTDSALRTLCKDIFPEAFAARPCPVDEISDSSRLCANPRVSVLVATYNHEPWIRKALDSILAQQCPFDFEILVGDDCSTDASRDVLREYQQAYPDKFRLVFAKQNTRAEGIMDARDSRARAPILAFLETDDFWSSPDKLRLQVDALERDGADVCFARTQGVDPNDCPLPKQYGMAPRYTAAVGANPRNLPHLSSWVIRRDFYRHVMFELGLPPIVRYLDLSSVALYCACGKTTVVPQFLSCYRITGKGIWTSQEDRPWENLWVMLRAFTCLWAFLPRKSRPLKLREEIFDAAWKFLRQAPESDISRRRSVTRVARALVPYWDLHAVLRALRLPKD